MDSDAWPLRLRALLAGREVGVIVVCLLVAAAGGWATYTAHAAPGETVETRTTTVASVEGSFAHAATVTRENPVYPVGTRLANRSTYFTSVSPVLNGTYTVRHRGFESATVVANATLVVAASGEQTTFWEQRRSLPTTQTPIGDAERVGFSVNVSALGSRIATIRRELGSAGEVTATVVVDTTVTGTVEGTDRSVTTSRRLQLGLDGRTYSPTTGASETNATAGVERQETVRTPREYGPLRSTGGPLALLGGIVGAAVFGVGRFEEWFALTDRERETLAFHDDRAEYDEWIVPARVPDPASDRPVAETTSLADLVTVAVDADTTVLEHPTGTTYVAVTDDYRFVYHAPVARDESPGDSIDTADSTPPDGPDLGSPARPDGRGAHDGVATRDDHPTTDQSDDSGAAPGDVQIDVDSAVTHDDSPTGDGSATQTDDPTETDGRHSGDEATDEQARGESATERDADEETPDGPTDEDDSDESTDETDAGEPDESTDEDDCDGRADDNDAGESDERADDNDADGSATERADPAETGHVDSPAVEYPASGADGATDDDEE